MSVRARLVERWCLFMRHDTHWMFGDEGIAVRYCRRCDLVHDVTVVGQPSESSVSVLLPEAADTDRGGSEGCRPSPAPSPAPHHTEQEQR